MARFLITLLAVPILLWVPASYAGGGHHGGYHGGYYGGYGYHGGYHRGHHGYRSSLFISFAPYWGRPYYYPPYYPAPVTVPVLAVPAVYVEKSEQQQPYYWYYCTDPEGYYPYVKQCPPGWMQVVPRSQPR